MKDARSAALEILQRVDRQKAYSNILLSMAAEEVQACDNFPLLERLVKGTLEHSKTLESALNQHLPKGMASLPKEFQVLLKLGAYQVLFLSNISSQVSVNLTVEMVKSGKFSGLAALTNAVLRKLAREPQKIHLTQDFSGEALAAEFSHPLWLVEKYLSLLDASEAAVLCRLNNEPAPLFLRTNTLKAGRDELLSLLKERGLEVSAGKYSPSSIRVDKLPRSRRLGDIPEIAQGFCLVQDEASALIAELLGPKPGDDIIDMCSAPGGKTTHMAALLHNRGRILALDRSAKKINLVEDNCKRLGVSNVRTVCADARTWNPSFLADRVLVDAPCSGLGVLGKRSDLRWNKTPGDLPQLQGIQVELLNAAAAALKPGGCLVYSTCTIVREENEDTVSRFLSAHSEFSAVRPGAGFAEELITAEGFLRTWPHRHGIAGGFAAKLRKSN